MKIHILKSQVTSLDASTPLTKERSRYRLYNARHTSDRHHPHAQSLHHSKQELFVHLCVMDEEKQQYRPFDLSGSPNDRQQRLIVAPFITHATPSRCSKTAVDDASFSVTWQPTRKGIDGRDLPENTGGFLFFFQTPVSSFDVEFYVHENPESAIADDICRDSSGAHAICKMKRSYRLFDCWRRHQDFVTENCPSLSVARNKPAGALRSKKYFKIFQHMRELSEDSHWDQFQTATDSFLQGLRGSDIYNSDLRVLVMQETAVCQFFQGDFQAVEKTILETLDTLESYDTQNYNVLVARGMATLSAAKRRQRNYSKCQECLDVARQALAIVDCPEVLAKLEYNQAAMLTDKASNSSQYGPTSKHTKESLERCIELGHSQLGNPAEYELLLMYIRAHICTAEYYLRSCFSQPPSTGENPVCDDDMTKAYSSLCEAEKLMMERRVGCRFEIRHKVAKADWYIRQGLFQSGLAPAADALRLATENDMELEVLACRQRRDLCEYQRRVSQPQPLTDATTFLTTHSVDDILADDDDDDDGDGHKAETLYHFRLCRVCLSLLNHVLTRRDRSVYLTAVSRFPFHR